MRKSTLFISAMLTVFMLAMLFGVASAYQGIVASAKLKSQEGQANLPSGRESFRQSVAPVAAVPEQPAIVSPEQAAALAAQTLGQTDVYSVESTVYEGAPAYLVTFTSGDLIYVSPTGSILAMTKLEPVVVVVPSSNQGGGDEEVAQNNQSNDGNQGNDDHEDDDHEDDDHDEGGDDHEDNDD
ncbi:MAG: hypothetical protein HZB19_19955 [Chloroflexi bacterium]|nr:hypothetical protein [Chloroflexota bacterium]